MIQFLSLNFGYVAPFRMPSIRRAIDVHLDYSTSSLSSPRNEPSCSISHPVHQAECETEGHETRKSLGTVGVWPRRRDRFRVPGPCTHHLAGRFRFRDGDHRKKGLFFDCLLYTSDAADDLLCVDLGGRRIIK